jgi:hypothetical protein
LSIEFRNLSIDTSRTARYYITRMSTITKDDIEAKFPEVFESYTLHSAIRESRYDEKLVRERDRYNMN